MSLWSGSSKFPIHTQHVLFLLSIFAGQQLQRNHQPPLPPLLRPDRAQVKQLQATPLPNCEPYPSTASIRLVQQQMQNSLCMD